MVSMYIYTQYRYNHTIMFIATEKHYGDPPDPETGEGPGAAAAATADPGDCPAGQTV